jgi:hypothetical protein
MSKQNEQKEREKIHTVRPAGLKPRRSFSYTITTKTPVFDCAVALCTMKNALLVISNLTWHFRETRESKHAKKTAKPLSHRKPQSGKNWTIFLSSFARSHGV